MFPAFADQDFVLATHYWRKLLPGDVVVVNHPQYQTIIKRIVKIASDGSLQLQGDNKQSTSSAALGNIAPQWIKAKVMNIRLRKSETGAEAEKNSTACRTQTLKRYQPYHLFH